MATLTWTTTKNGNWSEAANWTPVGTPGPIDTALFVDGPSGDFSFVNDSTIQSLVVSDPLAFITVSGTLEVTGSASLQAGTLALTSGTMTLNNLSNQGSITVASSAAVELTGTYDSDGVERISGTSSGHLTLLGTMLNTGKVFDNSLLGGLSLNQFPTGTVVGGTLLGGTSRFHVFDGVTVQGTFAASMPTGDLRFRNGLTVVDGSGVGPGSIGLEGVMVFEGNATLDNLALKAGVELTPVANVVTADGTLTFGAQSSFSAIGAAAPGQQPRLTLMGTGSGSTIVNFGTVQALALYSGNAISHVATIGVANFQNRGLVAALSENGGASRLVITGDSFVNEAGGVVRIDPGPTGFATGTIMASVDFTNSGSVIVPGGDLVANSAVNGSGAIHVSDDGYVDFNAGVSAGQTVALNVSGTVDIATPQLFQGTITGLTTGTTLHIDSQATAIAYGSDKLTMQLGGGQTFTLNIMGASSLSDFIVNSGTGGTTISTILPAPCFAAGTLIRTDRGDVPVEALRVGNRIRLADEDLYRAAIWIGHREVDCTRHPDPAAVWPVRVSAHAFGPGQPARDLYLSPDHAVFVENVLIPVKHLINGRSVTQVPVAAVSYFHVELDWHDVILAEGLAVESYLDTGDRDAFANGDTAIRLFPVFGDDPNLVRAARGCAPLVVTGPVLAAVRMRMSRHDSLVA